VCEFQHKRFVNNFNSAKTIYADIARVELPKILPPSYRGISIRYFYYVRTTLFGRPVVLGNGDQYKGLVNSAIQLVSVKLVFLLLINSDENDTFGICMLYAKNMDLPTR